MAWSGESSEEPLPLGTRGLFLHIFLDLHLFPALKVLGIGSRTNSSPLRFVVFVVVVFAVLPFFGDVLLLGFVFEAFGVAVQDIPDQGITMSWGGGPYGMGGKPFLIIFDMSD